MPLDVRSWNFLGIVISRAKAFIASWLSDQANEYQVTMGYGVIGNTTVSGSVILGSSPGIPALHRIYPVSQGKTWRTAPSYSGLVLRPLTAATRVRIPLGSQISRNFGSAIFLCPKPAIYSQWHLFRPSGAKAKRYSFWLKKLRRTYDCL